MSVITPPRHSLSLPSATSPHDPFADYQFPALCSSNIFRESSTCQTTAISRERETRNVNRSAEDLISFLDYCSTSLDGMPSKEMADDISTQRNVTKSPRHGDLPTYPTSDVTLPSTARTKSAVSESPPTDQSFLRWSRTGSTMFMEPDRFSITSSPLSSSQPHSPAVPIDKSFLRLSRTTADYSDFASASPPSHKPLSTIPEIPATIEKQEITCSKSTRASSHGTFGSQPRRWSTVGTSSDGSSRKHETIDSSGSKEQAGKSFWHDTGWDTRSNSTGRPRPLSMSSATDSSCSGFTKGPFWTPVRSNTAPDAIPSSSLSRPPHTTPETDQAISAHLLRTSSLSGFRINPGQNHSPTVPSSTSRLAPPVDTSLQGECLEEDSPPGRPRVKNSQPSSFTRQEPYGSKRGKLDHLLGEGAETASVLMEFDRRVGTNPLGPLPPRSPRPVPPARDRKLIITKPDAFTTSPRLTRNLGSPASTQYPPENRTRQTSVDSNSSFHPSQSESVNTLSRLIPPSPIDKVLPRLPDQESSRPLLLAIAARNDLSTEQRALLLKRSRKLEQMLGESLNRAQIEGLVSGLSSPPPGSARTLSGNALPERKSSRNVLRAAVGENIMDLEQPVMAPTVLERQAKHDEPEFDTDEESARRARRHQLVKLQHMLGALVPPDLVDPAIQHGGSPDHRETPFDKSFMTFDVEPNRLNEPNLLPGWTSKLRLWEKKRTIEPGSYIDMRQSTRGTELTSELSEKDKAIARRKAQKFTQIFGDRPPQDLYIPRTSAATAGLPFNIAGDDKAGPYQAYKQSLEGLLHLVDNDRPRLLEVVDALDEPTSSHANDDTTRPYTGHGRDSPSPPSSLLNSPTTPEWLNDPTFSSALQPDPNSHAARRKRTGKLSHFFGETGIDFDCPPDTLTKRMTKRMTRRETLDAMMSELWQSMQVELRKGGLRIDELGRLEDLMGALRRRRETLEGWDQL